jgi:hypothetical protein
LRNPALVVALVLISGCSSPQQESADNAPAPAPAPASEPAEAVAAEPAAQEMIERALRPWTGDFDGMVERRLIRALVPYNRTNYFVDARPSAGRVV